MDGLRIPLGISTQVDRSIELWQQSAGAWTNPRPHYTTRDQQKREKVYDQALHDVERHARGANRFAPAETQKRLMASFARFSATALDLPDPAVALITEEFLPVGTQLARWARRFDPAISTPHIVQAS